MTAFAFAEVASWITDAGLGFIFNADNNVKRKHDWEDKAASDFADQFVQWAFTVMSNQ